MDKRALTICTLLSYPETAQIVAQFIISSENVPAPVPPPGEVDGVLHERKINLRDFKRFIEENCTSKEDVWAHRDVRNHNQQIRMMAEEIWDLWSHSQLPQILLQFKQYYLHQMSTMPTTTQMIERMVKLANYCSLTNRSEGTRSLFAVTNHEIVKHTAKKTKTKDEMKEYWVRSKQKSRDVLSYTINKIHEINAAKQAISVQQQEHLEKQLTHKEIQFSAVRQKETVDNFISNFDREVNQHALERRTGVEQTPLINRTVPYYAMTVKGGFKPLIYEECCARGIEVTAEMRQDYRKVIRALKNNEGDDKNFRPKLAFDRFKYW